MDEELKLETVKEYRCLKRGDELVNERDEHGIYLGLLEGVAMYTISKNNNQLVKTIDICEFSPNNTVKKVQYKNTRCTSPNTAAEMAKKQSEGDTHFFEEDAGETIVDVISAISEAAFTGAVAFGSFFFDVSRKKIEEKDKFIRKLDQNY